MVSLHEIVKSLYIRPNNLKKKKNNWNLNKFYKSIDLRVFYTMVELYPSKVT